MNEENKSEEMVANVKSILADKDIPNFYTNGFAVTLGLGDLICVLQRNEQPVAVMNISYTVAKTLALTLTRVIHDLEKKTKHEFMTIQNVREGLKSFQNEVTEKGKHTRTLSN